MTMDASWVSAYAGVVQALFAALAFAAAAYAAKVARDAARSWNHTLQNERLDKSLLASRDLRAAFGRCLSLREQDRGSPPGSVYAAAHSELWQGWREFDKRFAVARRYYSTIHATTSADLKTQVMRAQDNAWSEEWKEAPTKAGVRGEAKQIVFQAEALLTTFENALPPPHPD
jgi:hypothetical protein